MHLEQVDISENIPEFYNMTFRDSNFDVSDEGFICESLFLRYGKSIHLMFGELMFGNTFLKMKQLCNDVPR